MSSGRWLYMGLVCGGDYLLPLDVIIYPQSQ